MRLQKYLAERGIASRRHAAEIIRAGRVRVNGRPVSEPGYAVDDSTDTVTVDGGALNPQLEPRRTIMLNKPRGYVCSTVEQSADAPSIYRLLDDVTERLVPVGRLDRDSEGLLLLSNDGDFVLRVTHPRYAHAKTYDVRVRGRVDANVLRRLRSPLVLDGKPIQPVHVKVLCRENRDTCRLQFTLREGRNRQIRRMCAMTDLKVLELRRVALEGLELGELPPGAWRDLTAAEHAYFESPSSSSKRA